MPRSLSPKPVWATERSLGPRVCEAFSASLLSSAPPTLQHTACKEGDAPGGLTPPAYCLLSLWPPACPHPPRRQHRPLPALDRGRGPHMSPILRHRPQLSCFCHSQHDSTAGSSGTGVPGPAVCSDLLLGGRVIALGFSFHFPVAGQRVTAWRRPDSVPRVVLARFPPTQVHARGTPQLGEWPWGQ